MKNLIIALILFCGCGQPAKITPINADVKSSIAQDTVRVITNKYSNPIFFRGTGTSFPAYFQELFKLGQFEMMLDFTSAITIKKYGRKRLLRYYQEELRFGYQLKKLTSTTQSGDTITLNYAHSVEFATNIVSRFKIVQEGDSCKILLDKLKSNPF